MKYAFAQIAFGLGANALVAREAAQCIQLKASGGASGILGQLSDGQNRVGGGHPTGCYCLSNGGFTDSNGRGCILTPPTTQFQCDVGATPSTGFAVDSNGGVTANGSGKFYACPATDNGEYNVYTTPAPGQTKCVEISLSSGGSCGAGAASSTKAAPQSSKPAAQSSQPAYSQKPTPTPSMPAPQPSKPAPTPSMPAPQPSKPAPTPSMPAPQPSMQTCPAPVTVTMTVTQPAPTPQQPAPQPSMPAPKPSMPAPQPSMPAAKSSMPAPQPSKPAPQPSMPAPQPSKPAQSSQPAPQPSQPAQKPSGSCPADLNGNYQYPHLIVPVDSSSPSKAYGTSYNGKVNKSTCSIFNFDIPASYSGKSCSVVFLFPEKKDLQTSDYTVSGSGQCSFTELSSPATQQTSWSNQPSKKSDLASMTVAPGNSYVISSGACAAGQTVSYEMCSQGDFSLDFFQDYNPSPLGLYVRQC